MSTLADELLNDFEDSGSEREEEDQNGTLDNDATPPTNGAHPDGSMVLDGDEEEPDDEGMSIEERNVANAENEEDAKAKVEKMQFGGVNDVRNVASLTKTLEPILEVSYPRSPSAPLNAVYISCKHSPDVYRHLQKIAHYQNLPPEKQTTFIGSIEDNPEYHLLTQSNTLSTSIDSEIMLVHKYIRDHYSFRFPELERLVQNPLDYAKTVGIIGNGPLDKDSMTRIKQQSDNVVGLPLNKVLDAPSVMVVTVEASTSRGQEMSESELQRIVRACEMTMSLDKAQKILRDYVQSRMNIFAPNLTALIGSATAAQLISVKDGINGLAKTPACNLPPLGSKKQTQTGFATNVGIKHQGYLYDSPLVRTVPIHQKVQAMRIVSAKVALAVRTDSAHHSRDGTAGEEFRQSCLERLEKLTEPPPNRGARALPAPDDKPARKRGGRRARTAKAQTAMTDLRKEQNRLAFGKEEKEVGYADSSKGLGMIGQGNDGRVRALQIDPRTKARLSKSNKGWATPAGSGTASSLRGFGQTGNSTVLGPGAGLRSAGVGGTASTIAFTPVQGLELADPKRQAEMKRKAAEETDRWFKGGTFTQINGTGGAQSKAPGDGGGGGGEKDGFKVPALPARKRVKEE
ncbi:uncharacterized protein KY384_009189 [Bacidia gigantensis]|uniref:uncharacterized protein n=1 Tax=Bacidia gigantensis TaxID=2732470 RepID=UPI001D04A90C|nr:uncharacterized protein KY384_009189 [Bacidia gigantensis]KAG8525545.1 hypothetical protein KY384_009189 [Bacidia gigantensis]